MFRNTPILDFKTTKGGKKEYCDALVYSSSDNMVQWMDAYCKYYHSNGYTVEGIGVPGGEQKQFDKNGVRHINVSFYNKSKLMLTQPGIKGEESIQIWIEDFSKVRETILSSGANLNVGIPSISSAKEVKETNSSEGSPSEDIILTENEETANQLESPQVHINEVLCFICNKLELLPKEIVVKHCRDFYKADEITLAKDLLFRTVSTDRRKRSHIGHDKLQKDINDIITVFLEMKVPHTVQFVALDLTRLPPLSFDNYDLVKLCKDIETIKTSMDLLQRNQQVFSNFMEHTTSTELNFDKRSDQSTNVPSASHLPVTNSTVNNTQNHSTRSCDQHTIAPTADLLSDTRSTVTSNQDHNSRSRDQPIILSSDSESNEEDDEDSVEVAALPFGTDEYNYPRNTSSSAPIHTRVFNRRHTPHVNMREKHSSRNSYKKSDNKASFLLGKGAGTGIRAARRLMQQSYQRENKRCIGLFITNLDPRTTEQQIYRNVLNHTGLKVRPEKLPMKYDHYCSFLIQCPSSIRSTLYDPDIWPAGCKLKPYFS